MTDLTWINVPVVIVIVGGVALLLAVVGGAHLGKYVIAPIPALLRFVSGIMGVLLLGVAAWLYYTPASADLDANGGARSSDGMASTAPTKLATSSVSLPISIDDFSTVPLCTNITGSGDVPTGLTLWLVIRSDEPRYYYYEVIADGSTHDWVAHDVQFGLETESSGEPFTLYAVLLDGPSPDLGAGVAEKPADSAIADQQPTKRNGIKQPCPAPT